MSLLCIKFHLRPETIILYVYSVSGCANPDVPANAWFSRTADGGGVMGCQYSADTTTFHCVDNVWTGSFINCSERERRLH